jgi:hypothetical protein
MIFLFFQLKFKVTNYVIFLTTLCDVIFHDDHTLIIITNMCLRNMIFFYFLNY